MHCWLHRLNMVIVWPTCKCRSSTSNSNCSGISDYFVCSLEVHGFIDPQAYTVYSASPSTGCLCLIFVPLGLSWCANLIFLLQQAAFFCATWKDACMHLGHWVSCAVPEPAKVSMRKCSTKSVDGLRSVLALYMISVDPSLRSIMCPILQLMVIAVVLSPIFPFYNEVEVYPKGIWGTVVLHTW